MNIKNNVPRMALPRTNIRNLVIELSVSRLGTYSNALVFRLMDLFTGTPGKSDDPEVWSLIHLRL